MFSICTAKQSKLVIDEKCSQANLSFFFVSFLKKKIFWGNIREMALCVWPVVQDNTGGKTIWRFTQIDRILSQVSHHLQEDVFNLTGPWTDQVDCQCHDVTRYITAYI